MGLLCTFILHTTNVGAFLPSETVSFCQQHLKTTFDLPVLMVLPAAFESLKGCIWDYFRGTLSSPMKLIPHQMNIFPA